MTIPPAPAAHADLAELPGKVARAVRASAPVRRLRRYAWPYRALVTLQGKELAAIWAAATLAWLVGWVLFGDLPAPVRIGGALMSLVVGAGALGAFTFAWL